MSCPAEFPDTFKEMGSKWIVHRETCGVPHSCCITKRNETLRNLQCGDTMQDEVTIKYIKLFKNRNITL
jgi:hypothetical protein